MLFLFSISRRWHIQIRLRPLSGTPPLAVPVLRSSFVVFLGPNFAPKLAVLRRSLGGIV